MKDRYNVIVVLSGGYNKKTGKLTRDVVSRVKKGYDIWKTQGRQFILFSGDNDNLKNGLTITEDMKLLLLKLGVPYDLIKTEPNSKDTWENLTMSLEIIKRMRWKRVCVVSNRAHILRARYYWKRIKKIDSSVNNINIDFSGLSYLNWWSIVWEILAWGKTILNRLLGKR